MRDEERENQRWGEKQTVYIRVQYTYDIFIHEIIKNLIDMVGRKVRKV